MTLLRRLEMVFGGPARPLDLTVREADLLADACSALLDERKKLSLPQEDAMDYQSDSETNAELFALRKRLYKFVGYTKDIG